METARPGDDPGCGAGAGAARAEDGAQAGAARAEDGAQAGGALAGATAAIERLRQAGLRVTAVRVAVLEAVAGSPHLDVDALWREVGRRLGSVSKQATYDALEALRNAALVRKIEPAGSPARYETRAGDNHHHAVCRSCGVAADVDCAVGAAPCLEPADSHGFVIDEAEVVFWGLCPDCAAS